MNCTSLLMHASLEQFHTSDNVKELSQQLTCHITNKVQCIYYINIFLRYVVSGNTVIVRYGFGGRLLEKRLSC